MKAIWLHTFSAISALWVILNLTFWMLPIIVLSIGKIAGPAWPFWDRWLTFCYHAAVRMNSLWMLRVVRVNVEISGELSSHPSPIVICNHKSWFDIPIVHHVISDHGPILLFLIKRQLLWVPVVGWLCWIYGMPALYRGAGHNAREKDYETLRRFSERAASSEGGVLIYPEGTRFSEEKRDAQQSPYGHLLKPRIGGIRIMQEVVDPDTPIVDLSIVYVGGNSLFWDCLHGATRTVNVTIASHRIGDIDNLAAWLNDRWQEKENLLAAESEQRQETHSGSTVSNL